MSIIAHAISALLDVGKYLKNFCQGSEATFETVGNVSESLRLRRQKAEIREVVADLFVMFKLRAKLSSAIRSYAEAIRRKKGIATEASEQDKVAAFAEELERDIERFGYYDEHGLPPDIAVMLMRLMEASKKIIQALRNDAAGLERLSPEDLLIVADRLDVIRQMLEAISMDVWSIKNEIQSVSDRRESELFKRAGITRRSTAAIYLDSLQLRELDIELAAIYEEAFRRQESLRLERAGVDLASGIDTKKLSG